jgi:hypothetical protein
LARYLSQLTKHNQTQIRDPNTWSLVNFSSPNQTPAATSDTTQQKETDFQKVAFPDENPLLLCLRTNKSTRKMSEFKQVELFGGAITADFPAAFGDVR